MRAEPEICFCDGAGDPADFLGIAVQPIHFVPFGKLRVLVHRLERVKGLPSSASGQASRPFFQIHRTNPKQQIDIK